MNVVVRIPTGPLALFVDKLWHIQADNLALWGRNLPILHAELMINFSDHFSVQQADGRRLFADQESWLSGMQTKPSWSQTSGRHETMGALLKPWGLYSLTGIPASEFTNLATSQQDVVGSSVVQLTDTLRQTSDPNAKLAILEQFLTKLYINEDIPAYLFYADQYLQRQPFRDGIITDLCQHLRISRKSLNESFQKYIGLSPSTYMRLLRFRAATETIATNPIRKLTDVAYQHGFFDQAHFIHLFRTFADMTPGDYQKSIRSGQVESFAPTTEAFSPTFIRDVT